MKSGYNATRRNRNLGTPKRGHGRDNTMRIPSLCHDERSWWENIGPHTRLSRTVESREVTFLLERLREGCIHACTVDDICHMLSFVPSADWEFLETFVFRQSTRKQWMLSPTWGRLAYSGELGYPGSKPRHSGPAIFLEAIDPTVPWKWGKDLSPADSSEVERLRTDGHFVEDAGRSLIFRSTPLSVRTTQLYRTFLHEIGHWVDWLEKVVRPDRAGAATHEELSDRFFDRPKQEREQFAHRYAESLQRRLVAQGCIPFPTIGGHPNQEIAKPRISESANRSPS